MLSAVSMGARRSLLSASTQQAARRAAPACLLLQQQLRFKSTTQDSSNKTAAPPSSTSSSSSSSPDPTSKEVLASEAAAEADAALTRHRAEGDVVAAGVVSGAPHELLRRPVRIYQPAQESTQSARATSHHWRIDWDTLPGAGRWENGLMGWASSADVVQGTHIKFKSKADAIRFAEKQGYPYFIQEPHHARIPPKAYANNFLYSKDKPRYIRTK